MRAEQEFFLKLVLKKFHCGVRSLLALVRTLEIVCQLNMVPMSRVGEGTCMYAATHRNTHPFCIEIEMHHSDTHAFTYMKGNISYVLHEKYLK